MKFNGLSHHKLMVVNLHSVLFRFWNNLASHLERSAFKQRFVCRTSHSMLRLPRRCAILLCLGNGPILPCIERSNLRFSPSPYLRIWAFAAPLPQLTLLRLLIQDCPSPRNPFDGEKVLRTFSFICLTHSYGYASATDHPTCFASLPQNSKSW